MYYKNFYRKPEPETTIEARPQQNGLNLVAIVKLLEGLENHPIVQHSDTDFHQIGCQAALTRVFTLLENTKKLSKTDFQRIQTVLKTVERINQKREPEKTAEGRLNPTLTRSKLLLRKAKSLNA